MKGYLICAGANKALFWSDMRSFTTMSWEKYTFLPLLEALQMTLGPEKKNASKQHQPY